MSHDVTRELSAFQCETEKAKELLNADPVYQTVRAELLRIMQKEYPAAWERRRVVLLAELYNECVTSVTR